MNGSTVEMPVTSRKNRPRAPDPPSRTVLRIARDVLHIEAEGLLHLAERLDENFPQAVNWILHTDGRVIVTGIGKSGLVGRKIAATFSSTGTPAFFLHPVEALHGDLGMVRSGDLVLALSNSGETEEINAMLPNLKVLGTPVIAMTGNLDSTLSQLSDLTLYTGVPREACPLGLAPTASSTAMLAMGDALAVALIKKRDFKARDFRRFHPGGHLGERLKTPVCNLMRKGDEIPKVSHLAAVPEAIEMMNRKALGATLVIDDLGNLQGIFTDGDLRRTVTQWPQFHHMRVGDVMTPNPRTIGDTRSVAEALEEMEKHLITVLPVVDQEGSLCGVLHLHDLLGKGKIRFTG